MVHRLNSRLQRNDLLQVTIQDATFCPLPVATFANHPTRDLYDDGTVYTCLLMWGVAEIADPVLASPPTAPLIGVGSINSYSEFNRRMRAEEVSQSFYPSSPEGRIITLAHVDPFIEDFVKEQLQRLQTDWVTYCEQGAEWQLWLDFKNHAESKNPYINTVHQPVEALCIVDDVSEDGALGGLLIRPILMEALYR